GAGVVALGAVGTLDNAQALRLIVHDGARLGVDADRALGAGFHARCVAALVAQHREFKTRIVLVDAHARSGRPDLALVILPAGHLAKAAAAALLEVTPDVCHRRRGGKEGTAGETAYEERMTA